MGDTPLFEMAMKRRNDKLRADKWTIYDVLAIPVSMVLLLILALWVVVASVVRVFNQVLDENDDINDETDAT